MVDYRTRRGTGKVFPLRGGLSTVTGRIDANERAYLRLIAKEIAEGIRCEYCGMHRDKCECVRHDSA